MRKLLLLGLLLGAIAAAWAAGLHEHANVESIRALVERAGWWGPVVFLVLFGLEGLGSPGILFMLAATAVWPPWQAFLLNWLGCLVASAVGFWYARTLGRDFVAAHLPERVRGLERRVAERGFQTVVLARLMLFIAPYVHWAFGLSPVSFRTYLLGSAIAYVPAVAAITFFGASALAWLSAESRAAWLALAVLAVAGLAAGVMWRRRRAVAVPTRD